MQQITAALTTSVLEWYIQAMPFHLIKLVDMESR